jgi:hypothetical protein
MLTTTAQINKLLPPHTLRRAPPSHRKSQARVNQGEKWRLEVFVEKE